MSAIKCAQCSHENDETRVFCQNCGMRLERPEGKDPLISGNTPVMGHYVGKKRRSSSGGEVSLAGTLFRLLRSLLTTVIVAALLAAVIQMGRRPDGIPAPIPANEVQAGKLFQGIKAFSNTLYPRTIDVSQDQVNNYLSARIVANSTEESGATLQAQFVRAFVVFGNGAMQFTVEKNFLGGPVFLSLTAIPESVTDEVSGAKAATLRVIGGRVGRVNLPSRLLPMLEKNLAPVIASTSEETDVLRTAGSVTFTTGKAKLSWQGSKPPGR